MTIHLDSYSKESKYTKAQGYSILKNRIIIVVQEISEQNRGCQERLYRYFCPGVDIPYQTGCWLPTTRQRQHVLAVGFIGLTRRGLMLYLITSSVYW